MTHTVEATAWSLIHFCWQAAIIAGFYRVVSIAFVRRTSQARYALALAALLGMLASAVFTFAWEMRSPQAVPYLTASPAVSNPREMGDFPRVLAPGIVSASRAASEGAQLIHFIPNLMGWIDAFWVLGV